MNYNIPEVTGEIVMEVAKILANSGTPLSVDRINSAFPKPLSKTYLNWALSVCVQFGLAEQKGSEYIGAEKLRDEIKKAMKAELFLSFEACLNNYPPFLLYVDYASKGYDSATAAARVRGILDIKNSPEVVEGSLRRWGIYARLIDYDKKDGKIAVKVKVEKLTVEYISRLLGALEAELKTKIFLIDMLGAETFAFMDQKGLTIDDLSSALMTFDSDADGSTGKSTKVLEAFLWKLGEEYGLNVQSTRGLMQLADLLKRGAGVPVILNNHNHVLHGLGAIRNMTHHAQDNETGQPWNITKQTALLTTLFVPSVIRSLYLYHKERKQEI